MKRLIEQIRLLCRVVRHPGTPWYAKAIGGCSVGYLLSPIQLIPTFIPLIGQLDDLLVLYVGMKLVTRLVPRSVLDECNRAEQAVAGTSLLRIVFRIDSCRTRHNTCSTTLAEVAAQSRRTVRICPWPTGLALRACGGTRADHGGVNGPRA